MSQRPLSLNAWKHGGYSNLGVLPGEDPEEFDRFHRSLIEEFEPSGPTECDIVLSLANSMWRKSRLNIYALAAEARKIWGDVFDNRDNPYWSIDVGLLKKFMQETERLRNVLSIAEELRKADKEGLPHLVQFTKDCAACLNADEEKQLEMQQEGIDGLRLAALGEQITMEALINEIELNGRLDARIDRLMKRLFQVKAAKQMIGLGSRSHDAPSAARKLASSQT
jgi:hypothetical protein